MNQGPRWDCFVKETRGRKYCIVTLSFSVVILFTHGSSVLGNQAPLSAAVVSRERKEGEGEAVPMLVDGIPIPKHAINIILKNMS
jgi:hypothetical protein